MRDGLRSRGKLLAEACNGERGSDSTDDNATKLIASRPVKVDCGADSELGPLINESDGLEYEDSGAGVDIEVVERTSSRKKRSRTDESGRESEEDSVKKWKSKEHNEDGKLQVVCRVLRSMSAARSDVLGDSIGRRTRVRGGLVGKSINVVKSDIKSDRKNIDGNCIGRSTRAKSGTEDNKNVDVVISESKEGVQRENIDDDSIGKRIRGRDGLEGKNGAVVVSDESDEAVQKTRVRGGSEDQFVNVEMCEGKEDVQKKNIDDNCIGKRTRGRAVCEDKIVDVVISESKEDVMKKNINCDSIGKITGGRGGSEDEGIDEVISVSKEDAQQKNIDDGFIGLMIRGSGGSEDNSLNLVMEETNLFNKEHQNVPESMEKNEGLCKQERPSDSLESLKLQEKTDVEEGEIDQSAEVESHPLDDQVSKKLKRKRGRPLKTQARNVSPKNLVDVQKGQVKQFATQEIHQAHNKVSKKLKRKRGRPPKAKKGNDLTAILESNQPDTEKMKPLKPRRGRPPKAQDGILSENTKVGVVDQYEGGGIGQQKNEVKDNVKPKRGRPFLVNKGKPGNSGDMKLLKVKKMKCHKVGMEGGNSKNTAGETGHSKSEKQAVRDKIIELLLGAGWEIQYRPRYGRVYSDAVYVNPEGRAHWSVTLAYRVLKEYFENGTVDLKDCKPGFKFIPIPEEELNILTKVIKKERSDKNKKKKKRNKEEDEFVNGATAKRKWTLQKRKLGPAVGLGHKMLKGRPKLKSLHHNIKSGGLKSLGTVVSVRGRKGLETHGRKRCGLMARNSQEGTKSDSDKYFLYNGKRTVLTWMIDLGTLALDGRVEYLESRNMQAQQKGRIRTDGIQCDCCSKTFTIAEFETHAGGKSNQPFQNIFLETGTSLLQCQLDSWHKQDEPAKKGFHLVDISGEDPNDDTCGICGDGGDLICCDCCPSTFHKSCLEIKKFPSGPWHCIYCSCKFCGKVGGNDIHGSDDTALSHGLFTCCLCEEKYHLSCVQVKDGISEDPSNTSFCGEKCQKLYKRLHMLFGVKHELEGGFSWTFVRRYDVGSDISLGGMPCKVDCNSKVAVALQIMDECFMPMVDHRSGVNLIRNIVYNFGSNINRLNYTGFFNAILERGDEMVAVASIRIHGNQLAEMPFIGTRYMYRRQGMCRRLLTAIEMALRSLNVEKLAIPAISELRGTWSSVFGFKPLEGSSKKILKNLNMMVFPGVDMLQKSLLDPQITEQAVHLKEEASQSAEVELQTMEKRTNESDTKCPVRFDLNETSEADANEVAALEPDSFVKADTVQRCPQICMVSDNLDITSTNITSCLDSSCDSHQQTGNEKRNSSNQICSVGSALEVFSDAGVPRDCNISETCAAESISLILPDGCLNSTAQDASKTKCQDQLCVISGSSTPK